MEIDDPFPARSSLLGPTPEGNQPNGVNHDEVRSNVQGHVLDENQAQPINPWDMTTWNFDFKQLIDDNLGDDIEASLPHTGDQAPQSGVQAANYDFTNVLGPNIFDTETTDPDSFSINAPYLNLSGSNGFDCNTFSDYKFEVPGIDLDGTTIHSFQPASATDKEIFDRQNVRAHGSGESNTPDASAPGDVKSLFNDGVSVCAHDAAAQNIKVSRSSLSFLQPGLLKTFSMEESQQIENGNVPRPTSNNDADGLAIDYSAWDIDQNETPASIFNSNSSMPAELPALEPTEEAIDGVEALILEELENQSEALLSDQDQQPATHEVRPADGDEELAVKGHSPVSSSSDNDLAEKESSCAPSEGERSPTPEPHGYDLRPGNRDAALFQATWIDKDETGTYDPHAKPPRRCAGKRKIRKDASSNRSEAELEAAASRRLTRKQDRLYDAACRVNGQSRIFTIQFSSEEGLALLAKGMDNWPSEEWNTLHNPLEDSESYVQSASGNYKEDVLDPSRNKSYSLRSRGTALTPSEQRPDLAGQPAARGCWSCYDLGLLDNGDITDRRATHVCSLVHDSSSWPCQTCLDDDQDCEPIIPPKVKKSCEGCQRRRINCSYARTSDHSAPCLECQFSGHHCIAGPNRSAVHHRVSLDNPILPEEAVFPAICTECLKTKKPCTLTEELVNNTGHSCRTCAKKGLECIVADQETPTYPEPCTVGTRRSSQRKRRAYHPPSPEPRPELESEPEPEAESIYTHVSPKRLRLHQKYGNGHPSLREVMKAQRRDVQVAQTPPLSSQPTRQPQLQPQRVRPHARTLHKPHEQAPQRRPAPKFRLTTKLCHPITFNSEDTTPSGSKPCHFCTIPSYPILGLGTRSPLTTLDPLHRIQELSGGHAAEGNETTRVCVTCTSRLMKMFICAPHQITKIPDEELVDLFDYVGRFRRMCAGEVREGDLWCSICPGVAEYRCCKGCGLLLCERCEKELGGGEIIGDFGRWLEGLGLEETEARPMGLRADAELLRQGGELAKFLMRID